jgi:salicylate hydroxylase
MRMRVLVIGGGIGGMAAAIALERAGMDPRVFERAPALTEIGAGLGLTANAMKAMGYLGAAEFVRSTGVPVDATEWRSIDDGSHLFTHHHDAQEERYGEQYVCLHRADLLASLVREVPSERVRLNSRLVGFDETPDGVTAHFDDGHSEHGDLLVGADGLRSTVRTLLFGEQEARFTGVVAWRALIPMENMPPGFGPQIVTWFGRNRHCMTYPVRKDLAALNAFVPDAEIHQEEWGPSGDLAHLRDSFAGAEPSVLALIDGISEVLITPIYFRDPLPVWGTDRVVLLGDAAHPAPSSAGQGAAMALEDALMLAACLGRDELPVALRDYANRRRPRTSPMLVTARSNLKMFGEPDPVQIRARNGRLQGMHRMDPAGETTVGWLYGHDPVVAAAQAHPPVAPIERALDRPEAQRALDLWRDALTFEDRAGLWLGEREGYERFLARVCPAPDDLPLEEVDCDGVPAVRVIPPGADPDTVVVHLHGGCFTMGSARGAAELAGRLAAAAGGWALVPDYRLAPEYPFPAALEDALTTLRWLAREHPDADVVLSGECAGAGLAVSAAVAARDARDPLPSLLHLVSPFCDLTLSGPSTDAPAGPDPWMTQARLRGSAASYLHAADPADPRISPLFADLRGLPPMLIEAAAGEALADDAARLAQAAERAGVEATLELVEDSVHSFVLFGFLPETDDAVERLAARVGSVGAT